LQGGDYDGGVELGASSARVRVGIGKQFFDGFGT
jgi:hypothetical protein